MGGPGKANTTTPEHLFAAGYAACFAGALDFVARQQKKDASKAKVDAAVSIGPREAGGFGLAVKMNVTDPSLPQADLQALVNEAHGRMPRIRMPRAAMSTYRLLRELRVRVEHSARHARACRGHPRLPCSRKKGVDGRHKAGHDDRTSQFRSATSRAAVCSSRCSFSNSLAGSYFEPATARQSANFL